LSEACSPPDAPLTSPMIKDRRIRFNGFKCSAVAHTTAGLWRHPASQSHRYKELSFWIEIARTLERGKFDGLFIADADNYIECSAHPVDIADFHAIHKKLHSLLIFNLSNRFINS